MAYYYRITDFTMIMEERETDLRERLVTVGINDYSRLPDVLVIRIEHLIHTMLTEYERRNHSIPFSKEGMRLGMYMEADTDDGRLSIHAYICYSSKEDCLSASEYFERDKTDYFVIRHFFLQELMGSVLRQVERIQSII